MGTDIAKSLCGGTRFENFAWTPLTCYEAGRSKTLFFDLNSRGAKSQISRRRRKNSQIQIQAPPNAPKDEISPQGRPSLLTFPLER